MNFYYTCHKEGGKTLKKEINDRTLSYLSKLILPNNTELIVTDLNIFFYSTNKLDNKVIDDSLLLHLIKQNNNSFDILEDKSLKYDKNIHYILPLKNRKNIIFGSIIFICKDINKVAISHFKTIKLNIEFLAEKHKPEEIKKIESNPIYNSSYITKISEVIDDSINKLYCDKNYRHIVELVTVKIDALKNDLEPRNKKLFDEIYNLLEDQKMYYGLYAFAVGNVCKQ